ncbi:hypothetical protein R1sor_016381 [Riccia sorocarpa]|uniref:F-box domain-containing protein n=1 Tax=Riccia sorocarpa TaxID=122646 RepID=A0ABD3HI28_9MARC
MYRLSVIVHSLKAVISRHLSRASLEPEDIKSDALHICEGSPFSLTGSSANASSEEVISSSDKFVHDLTPSIWCELPFELLVVVLSKLPLSALKKFCRVSKSWNALIQSEHFAHRCNSTEPIALRLSLFSFQKTPYLAIPNPNTDSWERHYMNFIPRGEKLDRLIAVHQGLLCYTARLGFSMSFDYNEDIPEKEEIILFVHNPLTRKSRRLVVPDTFGTAEQVKWWRSQMMGGLRVDEDTGSYRLVVAFLCQELTRKTFIYDSMSQTWQVSAAESVVLHSHSRYFEWDIQSCICCGHELFWLVSESSRGGSRGLRSLVKYNMKLDTWYSATLHLLCEEETSDLHLISLENRPVLIGFDGSFEKGLVSEEFHSIFPDVGTFAAGNCAPQQKESGDPSCSGGFNLGYVTAEGGAFFIASDSSSDSSSENSQTEFRLGLNRNSSKLIRLPKLHTGSVDCVYSFVATFKAFP